MKPAFLASVPVRGLREPSVTSETIPACSPELVSPAVILLEALRIAAVALLMLGVSVPQAARAQAYPEKPVRIVAPAAPGGGIDLISRIVGGKLSEIWGQQVLVENRPGANFIVGTNAVAKSAPDGYTLLLVAGTALTINPVAFPGLPYTPGDLAPIMLISSGTFVLLVNSAVPANSVHELLAHLRSNPGKLNHASNSATTILVSELLKSLAKVDYSDINYKGGVLAAASTAAGETQFCIVDTGSAIAFMRSGRARALAVTSAQRSRLYPDIPTLAESGVPGFAAPAPIFLFAPARTPTEIIAKINADLQRALAVPEVIARIEAIGNEVIASRADEASRALRADAEQWARLVKERNIRFQ